MRRRHETFAGPELPEGFHWFNEPAEFRWGDGLEMVTKPGTDFWQLKHCNVHRDNGHCLLTKLHGDFTVMARVKSKFVARYDQCGLILRVDAENWIKTSAERENETTNRLGSVVTNHGYSDWASQDIPGAMTRIGYRVSRHGRDFLIEASSDGATWHQLRVAHLHACRDDLDVGIYACSPTGEGFWCGFQELLIDVCRWGGHEESA